MQTDPSATGEPRPNPRATPAAEIAWVDTQGTWGGRSENTDVSQSALDLAAVRQCWAPGSGQLNSPRATSTPGVGVDQVRTPQGRPEESGDLTAMLEAFATLRHSTGDS